MVGNRTKVKIVKNKLAPPFKIAEFDIMYGQGISREGSLIDLGVETGIVRKAGAWYTYDGDQLGQGKENSRNPARQPRPRRGAGEAHQGAPGGWAQRRRAGRRGRGRQRRRGRDGRRHRVLMSLPHDPQQDLPEADAESFARQILLQRLTDQRAAAPSSPSRWPRRTSRPTSPSACSTGSRRSGSSTTPPSPACGWSRGSGRRAWPLALARELRKKGIDDDLVGEALELVDTDTEVQACAPARPEEASQHAGLDHT